MEPLSQCLRLALHTEQSTVRSWLRAEEKPLVLLLLFSFNFFRTAQPEIIARRPRTKTNRWQTSKAGRRRRNEPKLLYQLGLERPDVSLVGLRSPSAELEAPGEAVFTLCRRSSTRLLARGPAGGTGEGSGSYIFYCVFTNHFDWFSEVELND